MTSPSCITTAWARSTLDWRPTRPARILRSDEFAVLQAAEAVGADQVVIAPDERRGMNLERLLECKTAGYPVRAVPDLRREGNPAG